MKDIANFSIRITSAQNNTWQGEVTTADETFVFKSEIQLLKWICQKFPELMPD